MPSDPKPNERRFFLCTEEIATYSKLHEYPGRHIIGELVYVTLDGSMVTALAQWDKPIPTDEVPPLRPKVRSRMIGNVIGIMCIHPDCKRVASWEIGKAAFHQLMQRYGYSVSKDDEPTPLPQALSISKMTDV